MTIWKRALLLPALAGAVVLLTGVSAAASPARPQTAAASSRHAVAAGRGTVAVATQRYAAVTQQDVQYLQQAHQSNLAEIDAGKLAMSKSDNSTVQALGSRFVTDHTRLDQSLRKAAAELGVSLPSMPNETQQKLAQLYAKASQGSFDRLFVTTQMLGHTQAMQLGQMEVAKGSSATAKAVASDAAPVLASHMRLLNDAAAKLGIPSRVPVSPSPSAIPLSPSPSASHR